MGNTKGDAEFMTHYEYMVPELLRITKPGRLCVIHIKDMVDYMGRDGEAGLRDLPGEITRAMEKHGWKYHSKVTIWKDPVIEMQRTKNHGLLHKNFAASAEACRQGLPDYLIVFRKWTDPMPVKQVKNNRKPGDYVGEMPPTAYDDDRHYSISVWQRYASPVWFDISQTRVLNIQQARANEDEKHICPLQLDVIARCVDLWTNEGDHVFSPFAGIGSEGYESLRMGRKFTGIELKREYWNVACRNLTAIETVKKSQTTLEFEDAEG
jgi:DNA modification methylase